MSPFWTFSLKTVLEPVPMKAKHSGKQTREAPFEAHSLIWLDNLLKLASTLLLLQV